MNSQNLKRKLVITDDGSYTLFVPGLNEHYHSIHGAVQESMHVFIQAGLNSFSDRNSLSILEVGFGTGLNALLTLQQGIIKRICITYTSIEKYPITTEEFEELNHHLLLGNHLNAEYKQLHESDWNTYVDIKFNDSESETEGTFRLKKIHADLVNYLPDEKFDLIYFDAFSPNVQPELWSENIFIQMYNCLHPKGILVTYSAKGMVKRNLRAAGFKVKRIPGPPGKREMLRATKEVIN